MAEQGLYKTILNPSQVFFHYAQLLQMSIIPQFKLNLKNMKVYKHNDKTTL